MKLKTMILTALLLIIGLGIFLVGCAAQVTAYDGTKLGDCPASPNCVCSEMDPDSDSHVEPFQIPAGTSPEGAFETLADLVSPSASIEVREPDYFHAVYKTNWLRFRDDLEARLDAEAGQIHVRSASRLGHSDLGLNRRRVENLRTSFQQALNDQIQ